METGLKLLQLNRLLKNKASGKSGGSSSKKVHDEKDILEIDKMVFSDEEESDEGDMDFSSFDLDKAIECQLRNQILPSKSGQEFKIQIESCFNEDSGSSELVITTVEHDNQSKRH
jgi:hypothetical protein